GTGAVPLPLLPSGPDGVCGAALHGTYLSAIDIPILRLNCSQKCAVRWRRGRDSNPRYGVNRTHDFQSCTFNRSVTSPDSERAAGHAIERLDASTVTRLFPQSARAARNLF